MFVIHWFWWCIKCDKVQCTLSINIYTTFSSLVLLYCVKIKKSKRKNIENNILFERFDLVTRHIHYDKYSNILSWCIFLNIYRNISWLKTHHIFMQIWKFHCTNRTCNEYLETSFSFSKGHFVLRSRFCLQIEMKCIVDKSHNI